MIVYSSLEQALSFAKFIKLQAFAPGFVVEGFEHWRINAEDIADHDETWYLPNGFKRPPVAADMKDENTLSPSRCTSSFVTSKHVSAQVGTLDEDTQGRNSDQDEEEDERLEPDHLYLLRPLAYH